MALTDLQRFIVGILDEDECVDPPGLMMGTSSWTAAAIAERSGGWYGTATVQRCCNRLVRDGLLRELRDGARRTYVATQAGVEAYY